MITEESFQQLLADADNRAARSPVLDAHKVIASVRSMQTHRKRRNVILTGCASVAAAILIVGLIWDQHDRNKQLQIAQLQNQIELLNQRLDKTMAMVQQTLVTQRQQEKLNQLEGQLAEYDAAGQKRQAQEESTALTILIQADRLQNANLHGDAQIFYKRIMELYPDTCWAQVARQKLESLQPVNKTEKKGNTI
jgi:hypothetical protein